MISLESQVLQRHLTFFDNKSVLFAGGISDDFPQQINAKSVKIWSWYFDYTKTQHTVDFCLEIDTQADLVIFYWTKNKQEAQFQLMQLLANASVGQEILIIGENRCGVRSVEKILAPYGEIAKIDSARRCGLYHFCLKHSVNFIFEKYWKTYQHMKLNGLTIYSLPGVFSANELDVGTDLLLSTLEQTIRGDVLDMGCGAGVIGAYIKQHNPKVHITMTDIHATALASAKRTLVENKLEGEVVASDIFSHITGKFDLIISNPPFHDGIDTAYRVVTELIGQAKWHLKQGGELRIVANAFLPYPDLLDQHFGSHQVLAKTNKFKVYSVTY
ncbi:16S rRNA (guanine(1207)-N(2))-methyltransferase RsmC [Pasteurella canis]|uniref:Ribosomal RNA small subunit methyltransferase C n=1 Tax=Pasteurella canis TaxID=753 RepID=A0ABQ4VF81_9PAST|nr:16S rRNA (guanine(1207)-N(2))-methyltransferase RsmC [Pasteurella canis]UEC23510.1 16S rRNA (guanine(1207)-N(2))-methyltransferase RsmC [Pasteurella canis]GJH42040.1 ribosomal RNA small subunit methyltransferase C [Pasteurella canis]